MFSSENSSVSTIQICLMSIVLCHELVVFKKIVKFLTQKPNIKKKKMIKSEIFGLERRWTLTCSRP